MSDIVAIQYQDKKRDNVVRVEWMLSKKCNFNCSYCTEYVHNKTDGFPSLEVMNSTIDRLCEKTNKEIHLAITGGEPVLCKHLIEFVKHAKSKQQVTHIAITTNGSRSANYYRKLVEYVDHITFSYHFEYGKVERVPDNIKDLAQTHLDKIAVHMMMLPTVLDEAKELIEDLRSHNIAVSVRRIRPAFHKGDLEKGITRWTKPFEDTVATYVFLEYDQETGKGKVDWAQDKGYYSDVEEEYLAQVPVSFKHDSIAYYHSEDAIKIMTKNKNEVLMDKENFFEGWLCWSGVTSLKILDNGDVYNASCRVKQFGSIYTDFELGTAPLECTKQACVCAADIPITKIKNRLFSNVVRLKDD
jgi:sulfatase maturation enzyme AslB (radical SAM superfamily)